MAAHDEPSTAVAAVATLETSTPVAAVAEPEHNTAVADELVGLELQQIIEDADEQRCERILAWLCDFCTLETSIWVCGKWCISCCFW